MSLNAQDDREKINSQEGPHRNEVGLNLSNVIINLVGNTGNVDDSDPANYSISYKRQLKEDKYLRLAFNVKIDLKSDDEVTNVTNNNNFNFRVGYEKRNSISEKLLYYYGIDLLGTFNSAESTFASPNDIVELSNTTYGFGLGPVFGVQFLLNKRMAIGTEATLYGVFQINKVKEVFEVNTFFNKDETNFEFTAISTIPKSLYFIMNF